MKRNISTLLFILFLQNFDTQAQNYTSFKPGELWNDNNKVHINAHGGGMLYSNGKYYWFGEHKIEGEKGNLAMVGVRCYSSTDLYNWKDEGVALKVSNDSTSEIKIGNIIERPKVIYNKKTNKYVMWFHLEYNDTKLSWGEKYSGARSGIAISDKVTGPYTYVKSVRPNQEQWPLNVKEIHKNPVNQKTLEMKFNGGSLPGDIDSLNILGRDFKKGQMARDMTVFVDDDEKAYHIFASEENSTTHISQLSDDYLGYSGKYVRAFPGRFMEGPSIFKKDGKYYFIASACTGWAPNAARSAVASSIFGPWIELGNPCISPDSALTYHSQSTFMFPVAGKKDAYIFMADKWQPGNAIDGRYIWLPVIFKDNKIKLKWFDEWDLSFFDKKSK
jgi:beta-xylosidase